jgi:hypothetical protein
VTGLIVGRWAGVVGMEWERMLVEIGVGRGVDMLIVVAVVVEQMRMMFDLC